MHNTYISSTISVRCKGSLSFSINDYTCFLDDRFDRNNQISKSLSPCCACCANNNSNSLYRVVPINPSVFYGSRQSTLIQWPTSRRLILGGANQCYSRFPVCDVDRISYGKSYTFKERGFRRRKPGKGRYGCNVDDVDAEVLLSLLTDEVGEECLGVRDRNGGKSSRRVQLVERVKTIDKGNSSYKSIKKDVGSRSLEGTSKTVYESSKFWPRKEEKRQEVDIREVKRENFTGGENRRERREGSSGSSYYSFSSSGEFESDSEVQAKHGGFAGESSSGYVGDHGEIRYGGEVSEEVDRHGSYAEEQRSFLRKENFGKGLYAASSGVEFDWRKKSEKKLNEELIEQSESGKESSEKKSRLSDVRETGYRKSSNSHEYYDDINEKSRLSVNIDELTRQQHSQTGQRVSGQSESRIKYKQFTDLPEIHDSGFETTSSSQNQYRGREKNLVGSSSFVQETAGDQLKSDVLITREEKHRRNSQQLGKVSEIREIGKIDTSISHRRSETRMKNQEDDATITPPLVDDTVEQHDQAGHGVTCQSGSGGEYQHMTGISNTQNINIQNRSNNRISLQEENSDSAVISYPEAPRQVSQMDSDSIRRQESRTESQDFSNYNDAEKASSSNTVSGRRTRSQERYLSSAVKLVEETKERHNLTDERVLHIGQIKEAQRPTKVMSFREGVLEAAPSSLASSELDSQNNLVQSIIDEDALGSVARLQQASTHFVGEFVEKVRHEVSTSEVQEERKTHETKHLHESEPHEHKGLTQHSSGESQQTDHDSRRLSQGSGTKGPSDEMWHVTDPSSSQAPKKTEEVPEATATTTTPENSVVKRTGRSLWSVISDIVQLRWAPRSDTSNSRSGGKTSPNQSTSSEAFFSGHDPDENDDENVKQGSRSILPESSIVDQKQPVGIQGELSGSKRSKDTIKLAKLSPPYSSNFLSGSASKDIVSPTFKGTGTKHSVGTSSSSLIPGPSFPLPAIRMRRSPIIREISEVGKTDASGSDSMVPIEQQVSTSFAEVSGTEGKGGEKKQRKLQRSKQVPKDRFDEWEEAYILEAEQRKNDEMFMREALLEAKKAADVWEVPVGAVLVQHGKIIARGCNLVEESRDSTAHAEMICIREASNILHSWRLAETTLYVTLEPCPMCAGAILQARIDTIVWGAPNKLLGADGSWIRLFPGGGEGQNGSEPGDKPAAPVHPFHPNIKIRRGVLASECADAMQQFFQLRRKKKEKKSEPPTPPSCLHISTRHHPSKFFTKMHNAFSIMFCL